MGLAVDGGIVTSHKGPSSNPRTVGLSIAVSNLVRVVREMWDGCKEPIEKVDVACFASGAGSTQTSLHEYLQQLKSHRRALIHGTRVDEWWFVNDIVPLVAIGQPHINRIVAISGTGTGFLARSENDIWARASGHEYLLSDEGGGFDIGLRGLRAVVRASDSRGNPTKLTELASKWHTSDVSALFTLIHESRQTKSLVASFAPLVLYAARDCDSVAEEIILGAAYELLTGIQTVARRANIQVDAELLLAGSLLNADDPALRDQLLRLLKERCDWMRVVPVPKDPLQVVLALAVKVANNPTYLRNAVTTVPVLRLPDL